MYSSPAESDISRELPRKAVGVNRDNVFESPVVQLLTTIERIRLHGNDSGSVISRIAVSARACRG